MHTQPAIRRLCATASCILLAACTNTVNNITSGGPIVADDALLLAPTAQSKDLDESTYIPQACQENGKPFPPSSTSNQQINTCVEGMKNLLDARYGRWVHSLQSVVSWGNADSDIAVIGLSAAGGLAGGLASQIMNAASGFITGSKQSINADVLYNTAVTALVLQMEKDRACWGTVVEARLKSNSYRTVQEGFSDLIAYNRAGSFSHALVGLQASIGAQANASQQSLQATKSGSATASDATAGIGSQASKSGEPTKTTTTDQTTSCAASPPNAPASGTINITAANGTVVAMPFSTVNDPIDGISAANAYVAKAALKLTNSISSLETQLKKSPPKDIDVTGYGPLLTTAKSNLATAAATFKTGIDALDKVDAMARSTSYKIAESAITVNTDDKKIPELKLNAANAQLDNTKFENKIATIQSQFDQDTLPVSASISAVTKVLNP